MQIFFVLSILALGSEAARQHASGEPPHALNSLKFDQDYPLRDCCALAQNADDIRECEGNDEKSCALVACCASTPFKFCEAEYGQTCNEQGFIEGDGGDGLEKREVYSVEIQKRDCAGRCAGWCALSLAFWGICYAICLRDRC